LKNNSKNPPKVFLKFFRWFCHPKLRDSIEGDLMELYEERVREGGKRRADLKFIGDVFLLFRPGIIKPTEGYQQLNNYGMIKSYFIIGWRSLVKQKMYSAIKIGGFALGIAACLLITLYIKDELSYDKHYANGKNLYRVLGVIKEGNGLDKNIFFPAPMSKALQEDYPEVLKAGRYNASELFGAGNSEARPVDQLENSYDQGFVYFDQELADMLELPFIHGSAKRALEEPNTIVLTKRKAEKYFPNQDPVGKTIIVDNKIDKPYTVGGVIEDFKTTSHIQFDFLIGTKGLAFWKEEQSDWGASNYAVYVQLDERANVAELEKKMSKGILEKYFIPMMIEGGMSVADAHKFIDERGARLELQPIDRIHLYSAGVHDGLTHGDIRFVWLFAAIAGLILVIAVINFVNLSTAKSANRAKEVGLRKVVGSMRSSIVQQFLTESVLFSMLSFVVGIVLAFFLLPYFNILSAKSLVFPWNEWLLLPIIFGASLMIGLLAGVYPSFYLSSFQPIQVLKGAISKGSKGSPLRSALVVFQFTTSVVLIVGTIIIYQQMEFILNKKIGFEKDQVLMIQGAGTLGDQATSFKNELLKTSQIKSVTISDYLPIRGTKRNQNEFWSDGKKSQDNAIAAQIWKVDYDYISTLEMKVVDGRNFQRDMATDSSAIIVNQSMAKEIGGEVIGKRIEGYRDKYTIIGIVEDFHYESMKENIQPLCFTLGSSPSIISLKVNSQSMSEVIESTTEVWKKFAPHQPIRFSFLDDSYAAMYADVQRMGRIFTCFAVFAIIVACLGLFALSAFMIEQRSKEIGIRLVMGASLKNVFNLLTIDFIKLVILSIVIAVPLAWYAMRQWLQDFAYRVDITWQVFAVAGLVALLIALFTISYQSVRAGLVNPVKSLKSE
jgi:putative ABC transport system permease protein